MFVIRTAQLEALSRAREEAFERRAAAHVKAKFPEKCKELGDEAVRESVRTALQKRAEHGFETEECILLYLELMYRRGFDFDFEPAARELLGDQSLGIRSRLVLLGEEG
jgi:hypothetical protein